MVAKRSSYKKPMEWVYAMDSNSLATVVTTRIELGLKDDEVAEILAIQGSIELPPLVESSDLLRTVDLLLSMDPDTTNDPTNGDSLKDLEVFYNTFNKNQTYSANATDFFYQNLIRRAFEFTFPQPVLVGTDVGMATKCNAAAAHITEVRLYFTRRKANVMELNQILLKRR